MSESVKEKLILLKKTKYGESDLIVQGLSAREGKISLLAKGALRSKKRFGGGVLEPTHHIEVQFKRPQSFDRLCLLEEATILNDFAGIRSSYDRLDVALKVVDSALIVSQPGDPHAEAVYNLVGSALNVLASGIELAHFRLHYAIRFLRIQGVLNEESWMKPFLQTPMASSTKIESKTTDSSHLKWIETILEKYLAQAES